MLALRIRSLQKFVLIALLSVTSMTGTIALLQYYAPRTSTQPAVASPSPITNDATPQPSKTSMVTSGVPLRLKIPKLAIDSAVDPVGVTPTGAMDIKKNPDGVVWFQQGPRPGDSGSAVMAGHYGWENGKGSVFNDLHTLQPGDKLYVEDDRHMIITFVVRESQRYDPDTDASDVFSSSDDTPHLNIVTCDGTWDHAKQSYSKRLVVFADKAR